MELVLAFWVLTAVSELLFVLMLWRWRRWLNVILALMAAFGAGMFLGTGLNLFVLIMVALYVYRIFNLFRVYHGRSTPAHLRNASRRASWQLLAGQLVAITIYIIFSVSSSNLSLWLYLVSIGVLGTACLLLLTIRRSLQRMQMPDIVKGFSSKSLPTVSVLIPARNETTDLEACLKCLTQSSYPKLEIIVLDDCSQNRRTPEIIRQFAHDGVKFMAGSEPPGGWLAKNYAYHQLAEVASGELLLFCGVDTRFEPNAVTQLVESFLQSDVAMASLMPKNNTSKLMDKSLLIQPARYLWELAVPRPWHWRPPILSTCWLAQKSALVHLGGFAAVRNTILPERFFARELNRTSHYRFWYAPDWLGISTIKSAAEQKNTAIRTRYPQLHRRIELTAAASLGESLLLTWPLLAAVHGGLHQIWGLVAINGLSFGLLLYIYGRCCTLTYRRRLWQSYWLWPLAVILDIVFLNVSMGRYELGEVLWKGRNVCLPLMQVIPELPKL